MHDESSRRQLDDQRECDEVSRDKLTGNTMSDVSN